MFIYPSVLKIGSLPLYARANLALAKIKSKSVRVSTLNEISSTASAAMRLKFSKIFSISMSSSLASSFISLFKLTTARGSMKSVEPD